MLEFDHVGITTTVVQPDENWVEQSRVWVTNPRDSPHHIEFLRYEPDSAVPEAIKNNPHVAFRVDKLEPYLVDAEILIRPSSSVIFSKSCSCASTTRSSNTCAI